LLPEKNPKRDELYRFSEAQVNWVVTMQKPKTYRSDSDFWLDVAGTNNNSDLQRFRFPSITRAGVGAPTFFRAGAMQAANGVPKAMLA
jgi:hypothetical protein